MIAVVAVAPTPEQGAALVREAAPLIAALLESYQQKGELTAEETVR